MKKIVLALFAVSVMIACKKEEKQVEETQEIEMTAMEKNLSKYVSVKLTSDLSNLSENQRKMLPLLNEAADKMNDLIWYDAYGKKDSLLQAVTDADTKKFIEINYGPWDRLNGNKPFVDGVGEKPKGANYYPHDITKEEFEASNAQGISSLYTFVRRNDEGELYAIPYHKQFEAEVKQVSDLLLEAANLAEDEGLKNYLELRAQALLNDDYQPSDLAWMDMISNTLDIVIGPIETYEDQLFGNKAAHEA